MEHTPVAVPVDVGRGRGGLRAVGTLAAAALVAWLLLLGGGASPAAAGHDMGNECYLCHNIESGQVWTGSYSIWSDKQIGMSPYSRPITCDICHTDYGDKFTGAASNRSKHPVRIISGAFTSPDNTWGTVYGSSPAYLDCRECHYGNVTVLTPDLNPDVAPANYTSPAGNTPTDGYPNHDNTIPGYTITPASWNSQNVVTPGTEPHLGLAYNTVPSADNAAAAANYALCFSCHDGTAGKTNRMVDVKGKYLQGGHYYKTAGSPADGFLNHRMPCSDCHVTHSSPSSRLFRSPKGTTVTFANPASPTAVEIRAMCNDCHADYGTPGSFTAATPTMRGNRRPLVRPDTVAEHAPADGTSCSQCHDPHNPPAGGDNCLDCHRTGGSVQARHRMADLEFPADGSSPEDNPAVQASGHTGVVYTSPFTTKANNECKKCHGPGHPSTGAKVRAADNTTTYSTGFVYGLSYSAGSWSANPASFADNNANGIIDGNEFCLSCHDGNDALSPSDNANIRIGGVNPPKVYVPKGGSPAGHDRKSGSPYTVSNNLAGQQLCASCHKYHTSDRQKLLHGNSGPYGEGNAYTYAMPSWAGIGTDWQAPKPASSTFPSNAGRVVVGNRNANAINYTDRSDPPSGKGFGTAGSTRTTFNGLCDACHRDSGTVQSTLGKAHTHEGDNTAYGSKNVFAKDCLECHNPHGSANIYMVKETIYVPQTATSYAVTFLDKTQYDPAGTGNALCNVCHDQNPYGPNGIKVGHNYRGWTDPTGHNQGGNCVSCHSHGDTGDANRFGFPQAACTSCHGAEAAGTGMPAVGDGATYHVDANNIVGTRGGDNTAHKIHVNYLVSNKGYAPGATCSACHQGGGGSEAGGHPGNKTNTSFKTGPMPDNTAAIQVQMDSAFFLTGSPDNSYRGTPGTAAAGPANWKTCITSCHRGISPSWAGKTQITADTVTFALVDNSAPASAAKGSVRNQMLEFTLTSNSAADGQATWSRITVLKTGDGQDNTVSSVRVYRDNGSTPGQLDATDQEIGSGTFASGVASVTVAAPTITTSAQTFFVGFDIAATAVDNVTVGARLENAGAFTLSSADNMNSAGFPASSTLATVSTPSGDVVTVTGNGTAPASLAQNAADDFVRLRLQVTTNNDNNWAAFTGVSVTITGTLPVTDIDNVVVYRDANANGTYEPGTDTTAVGSTSSPAVSPVTVTFGSAEPVTSALSQYYFVVLRLKSTANAAATVGASLASNAAVTVAGPDTVSTANFPISSANITITDVSDQLTLTGTDTNPGTILRGTADDFLRLAPSVNQDNVVWTGLIVTKTGTAPVTDLDNVIVYRDANADNTWQASDTVVGFTQNPAASPVTVTFSSAQTITTAAQPSYFVVLSTKSTATAGNTLGANIANNTDIQIQGTADTRVRAGTTNSGLATIQVPADVVTVTGNGTAPASLAQNASDDFVRFNLQVTTNQQDGQASFTGVSVTITGTLPVTDIDNVIVYRDANANGTYEPGTDTTAVGSTSSPAASPVTVTFGASETITTSVSPYYFVVLKLKGTANAAATVGASLPSNAAVTLTAPDTVASANFPISSANITITDVSDQLTLTGTNVAPGTINAGTDNAFLRFAPTVNQDNVVWTGLIVTKTGTAPVTDLDNVVVYRDANANSTWEPTDTVVGFTATPAASPVTVTFSSAQTITTAAQPAYFVVYRIKSAVTGGTIGAQVANDTDILIQGTVDTRTRAGTTASTNATIQVAGDTTPPAWDNTTGVQVAAGANGTVKLLFNGATDAASPPVKYNVYWNTTAAWNANWALNNRIANATTSTGELGYALKTIVTGLTNTTSYTFGIRAEDSAGTPNEETNTVTRTATPRASIILYAGIPEGSGQWFLGAGAEATALQTNDGDSSYRYAPSQNEDLRVHFDDLPGNYTNISSVNISGVFRNTTGNERIRHGVYIGGIEYTNDVGNQQPATSYGTWNGTAWATNPNTNQPWTDTDVNNLVSSVQSINNGGWSGEMRCTQLWITVNFGVAAAPPRETGGGTAIACNTCHQFGPIDNAIASTGGFYDPANFQYWITQTGSHPKHGVAGIFGSDPVAANAANTCTVCHLPGTSTFGYTHSNDNVDLRSGSIGTRTDTVINPDTGTYNAGNRTCSNTYCHAGQPTPQGGAPLKSWGYGSTSGVCNVCHAAVPATGRHGRHDNTAHNNGASSTSPTRASNASGYSFSCSFCHYGSSHVNYPVSANQAAQVIFGGTLGSADLATGASYAPGALAGSEGGKLNWTNGTCTVYCHTDGRGGAPAVTPTWNGGPLSCTGCHKSNVASGAAMDSGKHRFHDNNASVIGANYACGRCHAGTVSTSNDQAITVYDNHVNGTRNVRFSEGNGTWSDPSCSNTFCHQQGRSLLGASDNLTVAWNEAPWSAVCKGCHGSRPVQAGYSFASVAGEPNYDNNIVVGARNSHRAHVAATDNTIRCAKCHPDVSSATVNQITNAAQHINDNVEVASGAGAVFTWTAASSQCSNIDCHGNGTAVWGGSLVCLNCHSGAEGGALGDGTPNGVNGQWTTDGHGSAAGGSFTSSRGGCDYCHDLDAAHVPTAPSNPYRLRYSATANDLCLRCHNAGGDPGISTDSRGGGLAAENSTKKVGTAHAGAKHQAGEAGYLCWDCHDPHGVPTNILMVKQQVSPTVNAYGVPTGALWTLNFTDNTQASGFVDNTSAYNPGAHSTRICQVCHTPGDPGAGRSKYWRWDYSDNTTGAPVTSTHNKTARCTLCHDHKDNFRGAGGTNIEQFLDNVTGSPASNYEDRSRHPVKLATPLTYAGQLDCFSCHGVTGTSNSSNECLTCHWENRSSGTPAHPNSQFEWATPSSPGTQFGAAGPATDAWCLECHGNNNATRANLNGRVPLDVLPGAQTWTGGSGHGSTTDLSGVGSAPAYSCRDCHLSTAVRTSSADPRDQTAPGFHGSVNRKLVANTGAAVQEYPHPASTVHTTANARSQQTNTFCATVCHGQAGAKTSSVVDHSWSPLQGQSKAGTETHPSNMAPTPNARFKNPANLPLSDWLTGALPGTGNELCTTCHDPHGGNNTQADKQMLRLEWNDSGSTLCKECHV